MIKRFLVTVLLLTLHFSNAQAGYVIEGTVNLQGEWQSTIYLATIDKLDNYYNANAEYIINSASIDTAGHFQLNGDNLPDHSQFYRLYLVKEESSEFNACLYFEGDNHNFVHLILNNNSHITIEADQNTYAPFGDYKIEADKESLLMNSLERLLYPSYLFYEIKFPSELQFSQNKLNKDLFNFADTCNSDLVSLAAINNTDYDSYFDTNVDQYYSFGETLKNKLADHPYTADYLNKLRYYSGDLGNNHLGNWKYLLWGLVLVSNILLMYVLKLRRQLLNQYKSDRSPVNPAVHYTSQERRILSLIKEGKSNKEIASELFIELSTVKSHINKLYSKLNVKNRAEAIKNAESVIKSGV